MKSRYEKYFCLVQSLSRQATIVFCSHDYIFSFSLLSIIWKRKSSFIPCMYNNILLEDLKKLEVSFKLLIAKLEGYFPNFQTSL